MCRVPMSHTISFMRKIMTQIPLGIARSDAFFPKHKTPNSIYNR